GACSVWCGLIRSVSWKELIRSVPGPEVRDHLRSGTRDMSRAPGVPRPQVSGPRASGTIVIGY
ncbi:hypothetical protein B0T26DRAFT_696169, partial [Lasiosphaeria miniovina]